MTNPCKLMCRFTLPSFALSAVFALSFFSGSISAQTTFNSTDTPLNVPQFVTTSTLVIPAGTGSINDLNATINFTGGIAFIFGGGVLDFSLTHVDTATTIVLFSNPYFAFRDSLTGTIFDDEAVTPIGLGASPFAGSYIPIGSLAAFDGQSLAGTWFLSISDSGFFGFSTLDSWSLTFDVTLPAAAAAAAAATSTTGRRESDPVYFVTDLNSVASALYSSVPTAISLRESSFHSSRTGINIFGQRLNRLRNISDGTSNTIMFQERSPNTIQDGTSNTIVVGEGDGPEVNKSSKSAKDVLPPSVNVAKPERWEVYTSFGYSDLDMDEDLNFEGLRSNTYSSGIGAEYALTPYLTLGLGTSYTTSDVKGGNDSGNTDVEGFTFVAYTSAYWNGLYADLLYGATFLENDIDRDTGLGSTAHAEPNSVVQSVNFNTGYNFTLGNLVTGPYAGIDYAYSDIDGYTENGGGTANTRVSGQTNHSLLTRLGWQASYNIVKPWGKIIPQINAGWERENLNSTDDLTVGLVQSPFYRVQGNSIRSAGGSFSSTVASPGRAQDYLTAGAALVVEIGTRFDVILDYQGQFFADNFTAHYAGIKIGYKF